MSPGRLLLGKEFVLRPRMTSLAERDSLVCVVAVVLDFEVEESRRLLHALRRADRLRQARVR